LSTRFYIVAVFGVLAASVAHAEEPPGPAMCHPTPRTALLQELAKARQAWDDLDGDGIDRAMAKVRAHVRCLREPAELELVLDVHRAFARHSWTTYDPQASARAWLAVRDLAPEWTAQDEKDVASAHPVRELWNAREPWVMTLDESPPGGWVVDGTATDQVPMDRAFLIQAIGRRGDVVYTEWHLVASDVPISPWRAERIGRLRRRGTAASALSFAAGGALLASGLAVGSRIDKVPDVDRERYANRANVLTASGVAAMGGSALTMGVLWGVRW